VIRDVTVPRVAREVAALRVRRNVTVDRLTMRIQEQQLGAVTVLKPEGPVVEAEAAALKARLLAALSTNLGRFVVDMSAVPFVDSLGLEALADVSEELARVGQVLRVCGVSRTVREVFDLTDLSSLFDHFDDATAAVRSFL